jgi:hypothetical protein
MANISLFWPNGGDASTRWASPRKADKGYCHDTGLYLSADIHSTKPYSIIDHGPGGWNHPSAMEFDWLPMCKSEAQWSRLADIDEYVKSRSTMLEAFRWNSHDPIFCIYYGAPEHSPYFNASWARGSAGRLAYCNRIDSCLKPLLRLRDAGYQVMGYGDAFGDKTEDSQSAYTFRRIRNTHGLTWGIEPRPHRKAEWCNQKDIPVLCDRKFWHRSDPEKYADSGYAFSNKELLGEQTLIITEHEHQEISNEMDAGRSVAVIGIPDVLRG